MVTYHMAVVDKAVASGAKNVGKGLAEAKAQELALTLSNEGPDKVREGVIGLKF